MQDIKIHNAALELVNYLFKIFEVHISAFNAKLNSDEKLEFAKQEWVFCFQKANLEKKDVVRGANKIRDIGLTYMITPAEFIELCQPTHLDIGAPGLQEAFQEACEHSNPATWSSIWSHIAVKEAYKRTGNSQFLNGKKEKTFDIFSAHYSNACHDFAAGRIMEQIPYKKPFSSSEVDRPYHYGKYEMARPGVMKIYENVSSAEECFAICDKLLGKGTSKLHKFIQNLEDNYKKQGLV